MNFSISANKVDSRSISDNQVQISEFQKITEVSEFQKIAEISAFQTDKPTNQPKTFPKLFRNRIRNATGLVAEHTAVSSVIRRNRDDHLETTNRV